jgi:hypothetical protein
LNFSRFVTDEGACAERATLPFRETAMIEDLFGTGKDFSFAHYTTIFLRKSGINPAKARSIYRHGL